MADCTDRAPASDPVGREARFAAFTNPEFFAWTSEVIEDACERLAQRADVSLGSRTGRVDYAGRFLRLALDGTTVEVCLYATTADGRYNAPDQADSLWLAERPDRPFPGWVHEDLVRRGVTPSRDRAGYSSIRVRLDADSLRPGRQGRPPAEHLASWAAEILTGLSLSSR